MVLRRWLFSGWPLCVGSVAYMPICRLPDSPRAEAQMHRILLHSLLLRLIPHFWPPSGKSKFSVASLISKKWSPPYRMLGLGSHHLQHGNTRSICTTPLRLIELVQELQWSQVFFEVNKFMGNSFSIITSGHFWAADLVAGDPATHEFLDLNPRFAYTVSHV